ncbi:hypothetical protein K3G63_20340 [Hymenobacter sp. HSC-4F20]|uniref:hypothetical protein n=1 Tax=Hymenobacter sp. HSC-4F20 TaxID=2864135 RepID=UPI001C736076|nr:hypothetical protein [Hymenobacter sp. HSC-4F20]MBX0292804.1 hypothetical protein [Hymenobacter sp. HSC-4F20]
MADINIQRKKSSPNPWLLVLLVLAVIAGAAYFLLRADTDAPAPDPTPTEAGVPAPPDSTTGAETGPRPTADALGDMAAEPMPATPEVLTTFAESDASQPQYGREGLRLLTSYLVDLADRDDLRDATVAGRRDELTSATARLDEAGSSLRPGYVAATALIQAMQQKAYPGLEAEVNQLTIQAAALSGRATTPQDQQQLREYLTRAAGIAKTLNQSPTR